MSWITVLWSAVAGACLMLALLHFLVWFQDRRGRAHVCFSVMVLGVLGLMACELILMRTESTEVAGRSVSWGHVASLVATAGCLGFVHFYFGTGRRWLLLTALGLRLLAVLANFTTGVNLHFREILELGKIPFLGEMVTVPSVWTPNSWMVLGQLAALALLAYTLDASWHLWKTGSREARRRASVLGGSMVVFIFMAPASAGMIAAGVLRMPLLVSYAFLGIALAMGYELSRDILRAARLSTDLRNTERRLQQAAAAAGLGLWEWDIVSDCIWIPDEGRKLYGVGPNEMIDIQRFTSTVHPGDGEAVNRAIAAALAGPDPYEADYRIVLPDGSVRSIGAHGQVERDVEGRPVLLRGVSIDITERKRAEQETLRQRSELAHLSRVASLSELSGSLAHELNQPLAAILGNAQAALRFMDRDPGNVAEVREILTDIAGQGRRAGEVIRRMRGMLKKEEPMMEALHLPALAGEVLGLIRSDLVARHVVVITDFAVIPPPVLGDRIQLQQVILNLCLNACDAMGDAAAGQKSLTVSTLQVPGLAVLHIKDRGHGLASGTEEIIFDPFHTTKPDGLGMGLPICRSILTAHGGRLTAENHPDGGALFRMELPAHPGQTA